MKVSKRQLRQIIREEKARMLANRNNNKPLVESMDAIKDGMGAFMEMMDGKVEAFAAWLDKNPKVKEKVDFALSPHKAEEPKAE
tara:strand:- start:502 stop:753 length:252 start_codon:yes stop_codon:yes gene_type:complete